MEPAEYKIKNTMKNILDNTTTEMSVDHLWSIHRNRGKRSFIYNRKALVPLVAVLTLFFCITIGYTYSRIVDNTDLPFIDDPEVIGNWEAVDFVDEIDKFNPDKPSFRGKPYLNNLVFIKDGEMLDKYENSNLSYSISRWTKGVIISEVMKTASKYVIKEIDGSSYMFMEWKSGDYSIWGMKPAYYVLKKIDNEDYSNYQVTRIEDNIDYPFINNPEMLGKWKTVDYVENIDDFNPEAITWMDTLFLKEITILEEGRLKQKFNNNFIANSGVSWTDDLIIDYNQSTASKCIIKIIDGETYMFYEWKIGDYTLRGIKPSYYVLKKVE